jgi:hypothetical protein
VRLLLECATQPDPAAYAEEQIRLGLAGERVEWGQEDLAPREGSDNSGVCAACGGPISSDGWEGVVHLDEVGGRDEAADLDHQAVPLEG